jgi:hypothetical protein
MHKDIDYLRLVDCNLVVLGHAGSSVEGATPLSGKKITYRLYTGCNDKNGKEIYRGDILNAEWGELWLVIWQEERGRFALQNIINKGVTGFDSEGIGKFEIVGNLFQNPELANG